MNPAGMQRNESMNEMTEARIELCDPADGEPLTIRELFSGTGAAVRPDGRGYAVLGGVVHFVDAGNPDRPAVLEALGVRPATHTTAQDQQSVESFGFQWTWDSRPRTQADLEWRVLRRFGLDETFFRGRRVLDAGCGAGSQAEFIAGLGATVACADLSDAIYVAAKRRALRGARIVRADAQHLPFPSGSFDVIYCEGVLQHTEDSLAVLREFARVLVPGGHAIVTHYLRPARLLPRLRIAGREKLRSKVLKWPREWLFLATGVAAAAAQVPGLRAILNRTVVVSNPNMRGLRPTWTATYDTYGQHAHQRFLTHEAFVALVEEAGFNIAAAPEQGGVVAQRPA